MLAAVRCAARRAAAAATVAPVRAFSVQPVRMAGQQQLNPAMFPPELPLRNDEHGLKWADYRPEVLRNISATRNAEGDLVGKFGGEEVIFPDLENTLEWTLTTPVDAHLFEEAPIIKMYEEESADRVHEAEQNKH